ncbi:MAG: hypothetical protein ABSB71_01090 [Candidatus Bathyarchaeia archaeon]|jgi:hypothetical protein
MSEPTKNEEQKKGWTSEDWKNMIDAVAPLIQEWFQLQKEKEASYERRINSLSKHNRRLSISLITFLLVVVGLMSVLTIYGKVSGDALLFLVGTVTGYVVIMIQNLTQPLFESKEED